jgi:coenzyme F420-reducing hydrogenase gamma subunit
MSNTAKPKMAIWKFTSCNGCQLSLLDCETDLLTLAGQLEIINFVESPNATIKGRFDISLVEGAISTPQEAERIHQIRRVSKIVVAIGACAVAGGVQALRNFRPNWRQTAAIVYPQAHRLMLLPKTTAISEHVFVDFELRGCPISKEQLLEMLAAFLRGRKPALATHSVCVECKARGLTCVMVAAGIPCMGPVTQAGCGAICPAYRRGCYGCFGPQETPNTSFLARQWALLGVSPAETARAFRNFNPCAEPFQKEAEAHEK